MPGAVSLGSPIRPWASSLPLAYCSGAHADGGGTTVAGLSRNPAWLWTANTKLRALPSALNEARSPRAFLVLFLRLRLRAVIAYQIHGRLLPVSSPSPSLVSRPFQLHIVKRALLEPIASLAAG